MSEQHEYLIQQLQHELSRPSNQPFKLDFNHPVKELIWFECPINYRIFNNTRQYRNFTISKKKIEFKSILRKTLDCRNITYEDYKIANTI